MEYASSLIDNMVELDSWEAQFAESEEEERLVALAEREGYGAFSVGVTENPLPFGTEHYSAWWKGWWAAEAKS